MLLFKWFKMNELKLNVSKCHFMIFCNKNKPYSKDESKIFRNCMEIPQVSRTKFLGITTDENVGCKIHLIMFARDL